MSTDTADDIITVSVPDVCTKKEVDNKLDLKAPKESHTFTVTATKINAGLLTDNPLCFAIGDDVSALGGLTVNGSELTTQNLTVNGTISGYATQVALDLKANASDVYKKTTVDNASIAEQATLNNGGGSVANPFYLYGGVTKNVKALKGGTNVTMSTDIANDIIKVSAPDVYTKSEVDNKLADKTDESTTNNSATAWSRGLASDGYHYLDTGSDA